MKKYICFLALAAAVAAFSSCSSEDAPVLDYDDPTNYFMPSADATDTISVVRRKFKEEEGSYLLFNDTLQHYYIGTDVNGDRRYFTELLELRYSVGSAVTQTYDDTYSYLATEELKLDAVNYLKTYILPHFSSTLRPFAWFLAGNIYSKNNNGAATKPTAITGERAFALACNQLKVLRTDAQRKRLANQQLLVIVGALSQNNTEAFSEFTDMCSSYYQKDLNTPEGMSAVDWVRSKGFSNTTSVFSFPTQEQDFNAFATLVLTYSDEQIEKNYAKYPLVVTRAKLFRSILISLGYTF